MERRRYRDIGSRRRGKVVALGFIQE